MALLEVKDLEVYYGVINALKGISFEVNEGEIVTLIGANGAGKTTTMQSVIGLIPARHGSVIYDGHDITKMPCHKIVHLGMSQVPEGRRVFQELTVYENLMMGAYSQGKKANFKEDIDSIYERFPRLAERRNQIAGTLSGGEQQMLAMGRALMSHPKLLMLDEPWLSRTQANPWKSATEPTCLKQAASCCRAQVPSLPPATRLKRPTSVAKAKKTKPQYEFVLRFFIIPALFLSSEGGCTLPPVRFGRERRSLSGRRLPPPPGRQ